MDRARGRDRQPAPVHDGSHPGEPGAEAGGRAYRSMKAADVIDILLGKLALSGGRHLYGVLGTYPQLDGFAAQLLKARLPDGTKFPAPLNVNRGILDAIPDDEFKRLRHA